MELDWSGTTPAEDAERERRLLPRRRERVAAKCPDGHDMHDVGKVSERCHRCGYFACELRSWGLL